MAYVAKAFDMSNKTTAVTFFLSIASNIVSLTRLSGVGFPVSALTR
jgi:hypothetical protein